jgi:predicted 3-demethylubiquinone-9 3-methyltransferase (glyoxalase superfamily)
MQKITPFLWFDGKAEEAAAFYTSIFKNAKVTDVSRYGEGAPAPKGSVMTATFELEGQKFIALNGGPHYQFTPAVSFFIHCETQGEIDHYWEKLSAGGKQIQCGWLTDKFGLTWQVVPTVLMTYMRDKDPEKAKRVMQAMLKMVKLDIATLQRAYDGA